MFVTLVIGSGSVDFNKQKCLILITHRAAKKHFPTLPLDMGTRTTYSSWGNRFKLIVSIGLRYITNPAHIVFFNDDVGGHLI